MRIALLFVFLLVVSVACAAPTVIVNGKTAALPVASVEGKLFVDVVTLMQLLGGKATYDAATDKLYINSTAGGTVTPAKLASFGTAQLPGDNGQVGQVYKLRTGNPVYFRLNSAEYTVAPVRIGKALVIPEVDEKLLVLHFSVQNPQQKEMLYRFDTLKFTAIDAMNVNREAKGLVGDEQTQDDLNIHLKPAQRIEAYTCIVVPAQGVVPKLMVRSPLDNDGPVLRYDLREQVSPLPAPIADPADPSGATALQVVPAQFNTPYPLRYFETKVEKYETVTTALDAAAPKNSDSYFVVTLSCKNQAANEMTLRSDTLTPTLTDADGQQLKLGHQLLGATANTAFNQRVANGAEVRVRFYFTVPRDVKPKALRIREANSRTYEYDVSQ